MKNQMQKQRWEDMSTGRRAGAIVAGAVQIALAVAAWVDLAKRPAEQVNGPKGLWGVIIAINFIGPISYFVAGRRRSG
ncbi:phospholipase D-like protein [Microterricola gilva]|uniref:Phospholipase D-like protein n=1 Tax=Microterricola gilva TaxID=393267 RepID=A0A4Q8AMX7_9MICO|nr:PLD nuclease N-terminal domain-containing protein [Microterricola gilva]RZU65858.1 phospholipase D-like protein [Microterricola gilva]